MESSSPWAVLAPSLVCAEQEWVSQAYCEPVSELAPPSKASRIPGFPTGVWPSALCGGCGSGNQWILCGPDLCELVPSTAGSGSAWQRSCCSFWAQGVRCVPAWSAQAVCHVRMCVKCRRGGKWLSALVLYLRTSLHLPRKQKYNFIIPLYYKGRACIVTVKSQCPLKEHLGLWNFLWSLSHFSSFLPVLAAGSACISWRD